MEGGGLVLGVLEAWWQLEDGYQVSNQQFRSEAALLIPTQVPGAAFARIGWPGIRVPVYTTWIPSVNPTGTNLVGEHGESESP